MSAHTPGPWSVDFGAEEDGGCSVVSKGDMFAVGLTIAWHVKPENADLIAAAPDMLNGLVRLLGALDEGAYTRDTTRMDACMEASRQIIAKARGEA